MNTPVSFELAKMLKEKGFTSVFTAFSNKYYNSLGEYKIVSYDVKIENNEYEAPTIAEVVMWLYEKYGVWIYPLPIDDNMKLWQSRIIKGEPFNKLSNTLKIISHGEISYRSMYSPTEAYEAAILYTLKNLI